MTPLTASRPGALDWTDRVLELRGRRGRARRALRGAGRRRARRRLRPARAAGGAGARGRHRGRRRRRSAGPTRSPCSRRRPTGSSRACPWARAGGCGGCDLQHVDAGRAARAEGRGAARAAAAARRASSGDVEVEELPGGPLGWRTRVRLAVDDEGRAGLRAHRSHDVLPIADCPLAPPGALPPVLGAAVPAARRGRGGRRRGRGPARAPGGSRASRSPGRAAAAGREWRLSPGVFWQVHPALRRRAGAGRGGVGGSAAAAGTAWDLYGGVGLFAAVLAEQVGPDGSVTVVESARRPRSTTGARRWPTSRRSGGGSAGSSTCSRRCPARPDVVVADPPRRGLGRAVVDALAARGPGAGGVRRLRPRGPRPRRRAVRRRTATRWPPCARSTPSR